MTPDYKLRFRRVLLTLGAGIGVGLILMLLAGCATLGGGPANKDQADSAADCAKAASADKKTPVVAVLRGTGQAGKPTAEARQRALGKILDGSTKLKANLLVNGVDGTATPPNLRVNTQMVATGVNSLERDDDLKCKTNVVKKRFKQLDTDRSDGGVDLLSALRVFKNDLDQTTPSEIHVIVLASALQTKTVNLLAGDTLDNPAGAINRLASEQLNFTCKGWRVYMIGENRNKDGQPIDAQTDVKLKAWWSAYFARCGGALVTWNTELASFPLDGQAAEGADNRQIPIAIRRTPKVIIATVGGDLLFATGSARLRAGADQGLNRVLSLLGEARGPITVTGHTDNTGTAALNDRLSRRRAETVASWLQQRSGLPSERMHVTGRGSRQPVASNATAAGKARNRRVVVSIQIAKQV